MSKKIKANDIINLHKQEFNYRVIRVTAVGGQEFEVQIQEKLNDSKVMSLVNELTDRSNYCTENNIKFDGVLTTYALLIKYFTDIQFGSYKSLKKQYSHEIEVVSILIDLGLYKQIISYFDKEIMEKINDNLNIYAKQLKVISNNKMIEMLKQETDAEVEIKDEEEL